MLLLLALTSQLFVIFLIIIFTIIFLIIIFIIIFYLSIYHEDQTMLISFYFFIIYWSNKNNSDSIYKITQNSWSLILSLLSCL